MEDADRIRDYITSGGSLQDVAITKMFIKKLMCQEILKPYNVALNKAISKGAPHSARTIVDTLHAVVMNHIPLRAHLSRVL